MSSNYLNICFLTKNLQKLILLICCFLSFINCRYLSSHGSELENNKDLYLLGGKIHLKLTERMRTIDEIENIDNSNIIEEESICPKITYKNTTLLRSISKSTEQSVYLHPNSKFQITFCERSADEIFVENNSQEECAVGANCANTYRWVNALVRSNNNNNNGYISDLVLLPIDCLCVIGWKQKFGFKKEAVIFE